jgi:hypothetical protein
MPERFPIHFSNCVAQASLHFLSVEISSNEIDIPCLCIGGFHSAIDKEGNFLQKNLTRNALLAPPPPPAFVLKCLAGLFENHLFFHRPQ